MYRGSSDSVGTRQEISTKKSSMMIPLVSSKRTILKINRLDLKSTLLKRHRFRHYGAVQLEFNDLKKEALGILQDAEFSVVRLIGLHNNSLS